MSRAQRFLSLVIASIKHLSQSSNNMQTGSQSVYPYFASGTVVKGFGRGSKELGIPTANFPDEVVEKLPESIESGIYFGWASVNSGAVHQMVMSVGWNPYFHNEKRSMETHIMHKYDSDFYGELLKVVILGYLRPEQNFESLDALIEAINADIEGAKTLLEKPDNLKFKQDPFFSPNTSSS